MVRAGVRRVLAVAAAGVSVLALMSSAGAATNATIVSTRNDAKLGAILVAGKTVYTLQPSKTACTAACRHEWPPVLLPHGVKSPTAGSGVDASMLGTAKAAKGRLQITYVGKRLYWSAKDKSAAQVHGNVTTKWGRWSTVATASDANATTTTPAATPATAPPATEPPATAPPATAAPETSPPATEPPATSPPATQPTSPPTQPPTSSPGNGGIGF